MGLIWNYLTKSTREMTSAEINLGRSVFEKTIPYGRVMIADDLGGNNRPWTEPQFMTVQFYILHLGPEAFANSAGYEALLVHELTHVWQGHNGIFTWAYVANSAWHQVADGTDCYGYTPGKDWGDYNVEQQASIVEDWYSDGMSMRSPLFRYIRDNIRNPSYMRAVLSGSFHGG